MKTQIVLPDTLMAELRRAVPNRHRSHFIAAAVDKQLKILRFERTLNRTAGCWTDRNHPDLKTQADINRFLGRFRRRFRRHG